SWEGSYSCDAFNGTAAKNKVKPSVLLIAQEGATFIASLDNIDTYSGATIDDTADTTKKGEAVLDHCGTDQTPLVGFGEIIRFKAKVDPVKGTGTLSGESIFEMEGTVASCKFKYKRTEMSLPKLLGCPAA